MLFYVIRAPRGIDDEYRRVGGTTDKGLAYCLAQLESRASVTTEFEGAQLNSIMFVNGSLS